MTTPTTQQRRIATPDRAEDSTSKQAARVFLYFVVALFLVCGRVAAQAAKVVNTDLCSLVADPERFNKENVRISAGVQSAVIDGGISLYDTRCEGQVIKLSISRDIRHHPDEHPDFKALDDAIVRQGNIGTSGKKITATFTGQFVCRRAGHPKRVLRFDRLENLEVRLNASE